MLSIDAQLGLSVSVITFLIGLPANLLAFYTFSQKLRRRPMPIDILLLNLTISDLVFLAFLPFKMKEAADDMAWDLPDFLCPLTSFVFYSTIYNSTFFLTAVSVERYLGVAFPIRYKLDRRPVYTVVVSVFFWVLSTFNLSVVYVLPYYGPGGAAANRSAPSGCYRDFTSEQLAVLQPFRLELCLLLFCVPFLISCFCYVNFVRILLRRSRIGRRRRLRAIGLALGTLLVFALCFGPYNASHLAGFLTGESPGWRDIALQFSTFNACLDPLIFYFSSSAVRTQFDRCLAGLLGRLRPRSCCGPCRCCCCCPPVAPSGTDTHKDSSPDEGE